MSLNNIKFEKAKAGLLLIGSPRFKNLGAGLQRGSYGERKSLEVEKIIDSLGDDLKITFPGIVYERNDLDHAMEIFFVEKVDFVIAEYLSWAEDFVWIRFLRDMPEIPFLFVNPVKDKMTFTTTLEENDFIDFLCSGTLVGSMEAAGSIPRTGRKNVKVVMGSREEINNEIITFSRIARIKNVLKQSIFGLLANYNEVMWSTYVDPYNLFTRIGPELRFIPYSVLSDEINEIPDSETRAYMEELTSDYRVMDDVEHDKFFASVRASIGLARIAERYNADAIVFNDIDSSMFKLIGLRPGFYHPYFNRSASVLVPEADIGAGVITYIMKLLSGKHVNYIEPFHIEAADNTFTGGHAGPNDHTDQNYKQNVIVARDVRFAKTDYKYAGAPFAWYRIPPGRKTMAQLTEENGTFKLVCSLIDSLEGEHIMASYSHSVFRPVVPVKKLFSEILKIGTTQHFAVVDGDYCADLETLAKIMHFDFYQIK